MRRIYCDKCEEEQPTGSKYIRICLEPDKEYHFCKLCYDKLLDWVKGAE